MTTRTFRELADELSMFSAQLDEHVQDPKRNTPPHPWRLDDWFADYREAHEALFPK